MSCTLPALTVESVEASGVSIGARPASHRRHTTIGQHVRRHSVELDPDAVFIKVDVFLTELERRLDWLEEYGNVKLDAGIDMAYEALDAVRISCASVSGELMDAGRRRAKVLVDVLEPRYQDVLATKETLESKANAAMRLMEGLLSEFEASVHVVRGSGLTAVMSEGWRRAEDTLHCAKEIVEEGIEKAQEKARQAKESLKASVDHALQRAKEGGLIHYDDVPVPWRVNPHILNGYRFSETKLGCIRGAFLPSNEFVNIWSHFIGLLIVLSIAFYFYPSSHNFSQATQSDIVFAAIFFFAACKCLVCSCMWHTMSSIADQTLMERFACVDYTGISLLIAASIMTTEYTAFYCEPVSRWTYIITTAVLGIGGVILPWHPTFNRADMAWARVTFYITLGATGFAPLFQLSISRGLAWCYYFYAPLIKSVTVYFFGAIIYASKMPEKFLPGWFDYFGGSHNIWHFAVLGGILFHYSAMYDMFTSSFQRAQLECAVH